MNLDEFGLKHVAPATLAQRMSASCAFINGRVECLRAAGARHIPLVRTSMSLAEAAQLGETDSHVAAKLRSYRRFLQQFEANGFTPPPAVVV